MSLSRKKILITGGTGFIGRNIAEYFGKLPEFEVHATHFTRTAPDISGVQFHKCDLRNPADVQSVLNEVDILIQAAATTSGSKDIVVTPSIHVTDNAIMNSYLMRAAVAQKLRHVVFFSCTVMYPNSATNLTEEDFDPNQIHDKYFGVAWTKVYIEKICEFFSRIGETKFTVLRHSNIYGPHDKYDLEKSHVFGASVTKIMQAENEIIVWGDGQESRDLLYIDDLILFVKQAIDIQKSKFEIVNVGSGINVTIAQLVTKIISIAGKKLIITFDKSKPNIPTNIKIDISKAKNVFSWKPTITLDVGIEKTLSWYSENVK